MDNISALKIAEFLSDAFGKNGIAVEQIGLHQKKLSGKYILIIQCGQGSSNYTTAQRALSFVVGVFGEASKISIPSDGVGIIISKLDRESQGSLEIFITGIYQLYDFFNHIGLQVIGKYEIPERFKALAQIINFQDFWVTTCSFSARLGAQSLLVGGIASLDGAKDLIKKLIFLPSVGEVQLLELCNFPIDLKSRLPGEYALIISPPAQVSSEN